MERTTTTDSLGIVTLATAAFKRGRLTEAELHAIHDCADDFTRVLSLANRYHAVTGKSLPLDNIPSPTGLRVSLERDDFEAALREVVAIKARMEAVVQIARLRLGDAGVRIA